VDPLSALPTLSSSYAIILFLMTVRTSALLLTTPIFGARTVPSVTKIGLALVLSLVLLPTTAAHAIAPESFGSLLVAIGKETLVGLLAGLAVTLLYATLQIVATLASQQIGFGFAGTVDIEFAGQSPILDHLFTGMATLVFLTGNFHHLFLMGIQRLFDAMPLGAFSFSRTSPEALVRLSADMFLVAVQIVLPLVGALLLTEVALGVISKTAPQMNVFFVGMPIKIAVGILAIILVMPFVVDRTETLFGNVAQAMALVIR